MLDQNQKLNYGIIFIGGDRTIEGVVTSWDYAIGNNTVNVVIDGVRYKADSANVLLMHKDIAK